MAALYRIYHNPRCSKSRQTLALLQEAGVKPEIVLYLESPPSEQELTQLIKKLGFSSARQLLRSGEDVYKALKLSNQAIPEEHIIAAMAQHPKLMERPVVVKGSKAVLGRPPENVFSLMS